MVLDGGALLFVAPMGADLRGSGEVGKSGSGTSRPIPSKIRATAGVARCLRLNTASKPSSTSCLRTR